MKRHIICALALGCFPASARAAEFILAGMKDPLPDKIEWAGVTVYGVIDLGGAYEEHGYRYSPYWAQSLNYQPRPSVLYLLPSRWQPQNNGLQQSFVGVKTEQDLGYGWSFIGKAEMGFNPYSLELSNGARSLQRHAQHVVQGVPVSEQEAFSDSGRNGQFLNGDASAGFSNASYGTLTFGRQSTFLNQAVSAYDPNKGSYAFSLIGNTSTIMKGAGNSEASRWDNSIKYVYQYGPAHAGVHYGTGGNRTQLLGWGFGADVGFAYKGWAADAYYTLENGGVNLDSAIAGPAIYGSPFMNAFNYTISNNEAWGLAAKYAFDPGGGLKDGASSKVTVYAGYVNVISGNPDRPQIDYAGEVTSGGWLLASPNVGARGIVYLNNRVIQTAWAGAAYETGPWTLTAAWYHENRNTYHSKIAGAQAPQATGSPANKGGDLDWLSAVAIYAFDKHADVYGGVTWISYAGDWTTDSAGQTYPVTSNFFFAAGVRVKF